MLSIPLYHLLTLEMDLKEERKVFGDDQSSSDSALARVKEAHPEVREEISRYTEFSLSDRIALVENYLANLQETSSVTTETSDSGLWSQSAPSESGLETKTSSIWSDYKLKLRISAS